MSNQSPIAILAGHGGQVVTVTDPNKPGPDTQGPLIERRTIPVKFGGKLWVQPFRGRPQVAILLPQDLARMDGVYHPGVTQGRRI